MSKKKLTLSVDGAVIERAKRFSRTNETSVSELVSEFLASLGDEHGTSTPIVTRLRGVLPSSVSREEYGGSPERQTRVTRVLLDINVVLDVLATREPFADDAEGVLRHVEARSMKVSSRRTRLPPCASSWAKHLGKAKTRKILTDLLHVVRVVPVDEDRVRHALALNWADFEDAVQAACAEKAEADYLVTGNKKDFQKSPVKTVTPAELLALIS